MVSYSELLPTKLGFYVYRLWAADGTCLYVGRTGEVSPRRLSSRLGQHRIRQPWWPEVARIDAATFASSAEIIVEERAQVSQLDPVHNKALRGRCAEGHDLTAPGARLAAGECRLCHRAKGRQNWRKYRHTPEQMARAAAASRRHHRRAKRRPGPGQAGLWA